MDNELTLTHQRDIRLDVVNTINDNQSRILTYVTSPDFDSLRYQSYTELHVKNELPTFWLGTGVGVLGTLGLFLIAK